MSRRDALGLSLLAAVGGITAAWWALALWPLDAGAPTWLVRTRFVCFGSSENGLPHAGGWIALIGEPIAITVESHSHVLSAEDLVIQRRAAGALVVKEALGLFVAIDPTVSPALRREGLARELVSRIQRMRREAGLAVSDRIRLRIAGAPEIESATREYQDWIAAEVLARDLVIGESSPGVEYATPSVEIEGLSVILALTPDH